MCGIVGYTGKNRAVPYLLDGLSKLEYRGYDSAGIAIIENGELNVIKKSGRLSVLENELSKRGEIPSMVGIGHTRWATHGKPSDENAHPHLSENSLFAVVHNGIIENYMELRQTLEGKGYRFRSETDTESVAHLVDYLLKTEGQELYKTVLEAVSMVRGSYALGVVSLACPEEIIAARRDSPLIIGLGDGENMIASDIPAIISRTKRYLVLDDNEVAIVRPDSVVVLNKFGDRVEKEVQIVTWDLTAAEKGGYEHFMIKEIMEQPKAVLDTIRPRLAAGEIAFEDNGLTDERLRYVKGVEIVACGSALHAGIVGKHMMERMGRVRCNASIASEFRYNNPILGKEDLCIIVSQSGETADTLAALRQAKEKGAFTIAIVNVVSSTIAREAENAGTVCILRGNILHFLFARQCFLYVFR